MTTFLMQRRDRAVNIVELSVGDIFALLMGRELPVLVVVPEAPVVLRLKLHKEH